MMKCLKPTVWYMGIYVNSCEIPPIGFHFRAKFYLLTISQKTFRKNFFRMRWRVYVSMRVLVCLVPNSLPQCLPVDSVVVLGPELRMS